MAEALFSPEVIDKNKVCSLICKQILSKKSKKTALGDKGKGLVQFKSQAKE